MPSLEHKHCIAIVPARGGSKRIPRKNVRTFCGKPMIGHSIEYALESQLFADVIVSTDDEEIASVARECGASVPFMRPADLADDHAGTDAVILHALQWLADTGQRPEYCCCLYATAPFVQPDDLKRGFTSLVEASAATAVAVTSFPFPIFRAMRLRQDGRIEMFWPEHRLTRSQDLPEAYHDAGQFYWLDVKRYVEIGSVYTTDTIPVLMPRHRVQDIDTPEDWERAELLYRTLHAT